MATWQVFFLHLKYWEHHPLCSFLLHRWQRWWAMLSCWVALCHSNSTAGCVVLKAQLTRFSGHGNISAYYHQVARKRGREDSFQSPSDRYQCPWMLMSKYVYIILPPFTSRICVIDVYLLKHGDATTSVTFTSSKILHGTGGDGSVIEHATSAHANGTDLLLVAHRLA